MRIIISLLYSLIKTRLWCLTIVGIHWSIYAKEFRIDEEKNKVRGQDIDVSAPDATVKTLVIPTNEELMIALDTQKLVK